MPLDEYGRFIRKDKNKLSSNKQNNNGDKKHTIKKDKPNFWILLVVFYIMYGIVLPIIFNYKPEYGNILIFGPIVALVLRKLM